MENEHILQNDIVEEYLMMYKYVHNTQFSVRRKVQYYLNFIKIIIYLRIKED